jgi:two-component system phosphate regulon response regulator PhoB
MPNRRLLLVEDDQSLADLIEYRFSMEGYEVVVTPNGNEALRLAAEKVPDLVVLDWMIEGISGIEVCRRLRGDKATVDVPIVMLTARGDEDDRIYGLEAGADDYVTKPFSPRVLLARVAAVMRRIRPALAGKILTIGDLSLDLTAHRVARCGRKVALGPTEFRLLQFFMEHPGTVFSRGQLLEVIRGSEVNLSPRTVDVHIRRLRMRLEIDGVRDPVRTVRLAGYVLEPPDMCWSRVNPRIS